MAAEKHSPSGGERTPLLFDMSSPGRDASPPADPTPTGSTDPPSPGPEPNYLHLEQVGYDNNGWGDLPPPEPPTFLKFTGAVNEHREGKQHPLLCLLPLFIAAAFIALLSLFVVQQGIKAHRCGRCLISTSECLRRSSRPVPSPPLRAATSPGV